MNFLAHLYLSADDADVRVGNFIGDYVKGRAYEMFPERIKAGILLHRKIDYYTDRHPVVKLSQERFRSNLGRYSGVVVDVVYDHILAKNWTEYSEYSLRGFSDLVFSNIEANYEILPERVKLILPKMKQTDRLVGYSQIEGLRDALDRMSTYTSLPDETDFVMEVLHNYLDELTEEFHAFFKEIIVFAKTELNNLV